MKKIEHLLKERVENSTFFKKKLLLEINEFESFIKRTKKEIEEKLYFGDLTHRYRYMAEQLYKNKTIESKISGEEIHKLHRML